MAKQFGRIDTSDIRFGKDGDELSDEEVAIICTQMACALSTAIKVLCPARETRGMLLAILVTRIMEDLDLKKSDLSELELKEGEQLQ